MKNPTLLIIMTLCLLISCIGKNNDDKKELEKHPTIGKYLYLTKDSVLHNDKNCVFVNAIINEDNNGIKYIDTTSIVTDDGITYCTNCFDDKTYEQVQRMIEWNCLGDTIYY